MQSAHMLDDYYSSPGLQDPVRIVLPIGSYQPQFERRVAAGPALSAEDHAKATRFWRGSAGLASWRFAVFAAVVCLAIAGALLLVRAHQPAKSTADGWSYPEAPVLVVESANDVDATNDAKDAANLVVIALEGGLSVFDHFVVKRLADSTRQDKLDYALSVSAGPSSGAVNDFTFQLAYLPTNEIVWSRSFPQISRGDPASIDRMTDAVVSAVGDTDSGAIMADQRVRAAISHALLHGYSCMVAAYNYIVSNVLEKRDPARECLEREVSLNSQDPQALALLSAILLYNYINLLPGDEGPADLERAETLAQIAFEISPNRSETSTTMFKSRFYSRRFDDAFAVAPRLLRNLPNSRRLSAVVGIAYVARGRYDEGMAILSPLEETNVEVPVIAIPMLALAAYMRGDEETAERFARRATAARQPMGLVVRIAVCETEKNQVCVLEASQQLRQDYPGFAANVPAALFRHALADDIRAKLLADLRAAGFFGEASR